MAKYSGIFSPQIHSDYATTSVFLDVESAENPGGKVDYDATIASAGCFSEVLSDRRNLQGLLRAYHAGPISGEGNFHLYYVGYVDDVEAQLNSASSFTGSGGQWLPLLVDFDLLKMHGKAMVHGVGYYERFYSDSSNTPQYLTFSSSNALEYMATELAYGHGAFIPTPSRIYQYAAAAQLAQSYIYPAQLQYANATVTSILYHDSISNTEMGASDYIRLYPTVFAASLSDNFMSQVRVTYSNGVVVCVNRHPTRQWTVTLGASGGVFDYNAVVNSAITQGIRTSSSTSYVLPPVDGWVVYIPIAQLDPYLAWKYSNFGASAANAGVAGDLANPAKDGIGNLVKFGLGMNPNVSSTAGLPVVNLSGNNVTMTYSRPDAAVGELTYTPQWSTDLVHWSTTGATVQILADTGTTQTVQVSFAAGSNRTMFVRLQITGP